MKTRETNASVLLIILAVILIIAGVVLSIRDKIALYTDEAEYFPFDEAIDPALAGSIRAELTSADLHIYTGYEDSVQIQAEGRGISLRREQGGLVIRQERQEGVSVFSGKEDDSVVIWLPAGYAGEVAARLESGDVNVNGLDLPDLALEITCASGEISLYSCVLGSLTLATASGDIWMGSDAVAGALDLTAVSGEISVYETEADSLKAASTSGDVWLSAPWTDSIQVATVSGDVSVMLTGAPEEYSVRCTTVSGRVFGDDGAVGGAKKVTVSTTSGDVSFSFDAETE